MRLSTIREFIFAGSAHFLTVVVLSACTSSSSDTTTALDPPHLRIDSIQTVGGPAWCPSSSMSRPECLQNSLQNNTCLSPGTDPDKIISVNVGPTDDTGHLVSSSNPPVAWTISPPLSCTGTPPCGFLVLTVDGCTSMDPSSCGTDPSSHAEIVAAGPSIPVSMAKSGNPLGFYRFHVELENQDATPAEDEKGKRYAAEVVVELTEDCSGSDTVPPPDSGTSPRDGGSDARVVAPDTGPNEPRDSGTVVPVPETGPAPTDGAVVPDARPAGDARVPDASAPIDSGPPIGPSDARPGG